jgi:hypothetical protein
VGKIGRRYYVEVKHLEKPAVFALCEELFKSDYCEEAFIACDWAFNLHKQYTPMISPSSSLGSAAISTTGPNAIHCATIPWAIL